MALAKGWMKKDAFYGYKMEQDETAPVFLTYDELQTGETGENENIPYQCQSGYSEFLIHNGL